MKTIALAAALTVAATTAVSAKERLHTLHVFSGVGEDGAAPQTPLLPDGAGNFYGATSDGGSAGLGTVFRLAADGSVTTIHEFAAGHGAAHPAGPMALTKDGSLFGQARSADRKNAWVVFKLSPAGRESIVHRFRRGDPAGLWGGPGLVAGPHGAIYGAMTGGGAYDCGTVFRIDRGVTSVVHAFGGTAHDDGCRPSAAPIFDKAGNMYGVTYSGGVAAVGWEGTVYRIAPDGTETVLHTFNAVTDNGANPNARLAHDASGNLYGTTYRAQTADSVAYRIVPDGTYSVMHAFPTYSGGAPYDGAMPTGGLILDKRGNLYGATEAGGLNLDGTVFKIAPDGTERVLYSFGYGGAYPRAAPTLDADGNLLGTTTAYNDGHGYQYGSVFELARK
ncbi:MAG TPA: choice-of-anchor tandem repeat GloVer-containing protein [Rhizomicrobium sp.]|nr:choice-of-anchor tandem repeat GloVer-containing protein [Rhizomicrobium sp.]